MSEKSKKTKKSKQEVVFNPNEKTTEEKAKLYNDYKALSTIELPKSSDGLSADKLTEDQKVVFKKQCQNLYGHKFSKKRKLPAVSVEDATAQLQAKMREKAELLKAKKTKKN